MLMDRKREVKFTSILKNEIIIQEFIEEICDQYNINNTYFGNIIVAVSEAVENAIIHGNKNNPQRYVTVEFHSNQEGLSFKIKDEGNGFDYIKTPDPIDSNYDKKGLFLIKSLSDSVVFSNNGSTIELIFNIASVNKTVVSEREKHLRRYEEKSKTKKTIF